MRGQLTSTGLSLGYQVVPAAVGLIAIPRVIAALGPTGFGVYTNAVTVVVLLSYLNFGIAPTVTAMVATTDETSDDVDHESHRADAFDRDAWLTGALLAMVLMGLIIGLGVGATALFADVLWRDPSREAGSSWAAVAPLLGAFLPVVMVYLFLRAYLEGKRDFRRAAAARAAVAALAFGAPVLTSGAGGVVGGFAVFSGGLTLITLALAATVLTDFRPNPRRGIRLMGTVTRESGWLGVSSACGAVLLYLDRFLLAALSGPIAVATFVAPYDIVTRANTVAGSVSAVSLPYAARAWGAGDLRGSNRAIVLPAGAVVGILILFAGGIWVFGETLLRLWLPFESIAVSAQVANLIALGVVFSGLAVFPNRGFVATGRARIVGVTYAGLTVLYVASVPVIILLFGPVGAAAAYAGRAVIECSVFWAIWTLSPTRPAEAGA